MKRQGHLFEKMATYENCLKAEMLLGKNKPDNRMAVYISSHPEKYAEQLLLKIQTNNMDWHKPREKTICDSYKGKERNLKIPCLEDQAAQMAWLNIAAPAILKRNYYYNCGSIPNAGQTRCVNGLSKWLKNGKRKYGATLDIKKFYDSCPHSAIRKALEKIFKDKKFVDFAMQFVKTMSDTDVGIAIGYPSSHWIANLVLMFMDNEVVRLFPTVKYTRYMDDMALTCANKRTLKRAVQYIIETLKSMGLELKQWNVFKIKGRGMTFLSYRFFHGYTLLTKTLMVRISRRMKKAKNTMSAHVAAGVISLLGILKWCNSFNFRMKYVYPYVNVNFCKRLVSLSMMKRRMNEASGCC